jgi:hypothetical protein
MRRRSSGGQSGTVDFGQYVDEVGLSMSCQRAEADNVQTPLTVSPKMPLEIVMQLFRRMG